MRKLIALLCLPVLAGAPLRVEITQAVVIWGAGVEPKGPVPAGHFEAHVHLWERKLPVSPLFCVWRVKLGDFPDLERQGAKCPPLGRASHLEFKAKKCEGGTWVIQGAWAGAHEPQDRLVVQVSSGTRPLGWASSPLTERLVSTIGKSPEVSPGDTR